MGVGGTGVTEGEEVTLEEAGSAVASEVWTPATLQAAIKNAARVTTTPAAGLNLSGKLVVIKWSMIALNGGNVQYKWQVTSYRWLG